MKRFLFFILPLLWGTMNISAQDEQQVDTTKVHLKGRVVDESQDPISLCQVRIEGQPLALRLRLTESIISPSILPIVLWSSIV